MEDLRQNLKNGAYKIPKEINLSVECIDFLNSCLRFDSLKRKDWDQLLSHPFLSCKEDGLPISSPLLTQLKQFSNPGQSVELNDRMSYNLYEVYQNVLFDKIEQRIKK